MMKRVLLLIVLAVSFASAQTIQYSGGMFGSVTVSSQLYGDRNARNLIALVNGNASTVGSWDSTGTLRADSAVPTGTSGQFGWWTRNPNPAVGQSGWLRPVTNTDTVAVNELSVTGLTFAEVYIADDHPDSITVAATDVYYTLGAKQGANGYPWTTGGYIRNATLSDSSVTVSKTGYYRISWSISVSSLNMTGGTKVNAYLFVNDVRKDKGGALRYLSGTNDLGNFGASSIFYLAANDILKLKIRSVDDGSGTLIVWYANFNLNRID